MTTQKVNKLFFINEPMLHFNYNQAVQDPRDGLTLFGPLDKAKPEGIRWAVIGPKDSIKRMKNWVDKIQKPVVSGDDLIARPIFPGFEAAFNTKWSVFPAIEIEIPENELSVNANLSDKHQRVFRTVETFSSRIIEALSNEDVTPDVWCVVIPEYVYINCRPQSIVPFSDRKFTIFSLSKKEAVSSGDNPFLFPEYNDLAKEYLYEVNFHNQLKARLLKHKAPTQIIRESTITYAEFLNKFGEPKRNLKSMESSIAWNISTTVFYKAGGRPWKLGAAREGVCYIGIVFKRDESANDARIACCAAQMFLDSGDGVVFKGAIGAWYNEEYKDYHLSEKASAEIIELCIKTYTDNHGQPPKELFIHGKVAFNQNEWKGFQKGAGKDTNIVGVQIRPYPSLKLFRKGDMPILRGLAYQMNETKGALWTRGVVPRLRTYPGREVPNPIFINVCRGHANLRTVMSDILALTKLNYNACNFADGMPVTLKFANAVGEILTAGPTKELDVPPLPFKYYI